MALGTRGLQERDLSIEQGLCGILGDGAYCRASDQAVNGMRTDYGSSLLNRLGQKWLGSRVQKPVRNTSRPR